jgi:16S rRNA processing protein RimM
MTGAWDGMVTVGRIIRPHGLRGEVVVAAETDFGAERFQAGARLWTKRGDEPEEVRVVASRQHLGRWLVKFEGVATIDDAERLRLVDLRIPERDVRPLGEGAFYEYDLVGCRVETVQGDVVGLVRRVDFFSGPPLLVIEGQAGEILVPMAEDICRRVDIAAKVIVIDPPEGLVELNGR